MINETSSIMVFICSVVSSLILFLRSSASKKKYWDMFEGSILAMASSTNSVIGRSSPLEASDKFTSGSVCGFDSLSYILLYFCFRVIEYFGNPESSRI